MMKKGILYAVTAVLLGVALMSTPLLWFLSTSGASDQSFIARDGIATEEFKRAVARSELAAGVTPQHPSDEISVGSMSAFSLLLAFVVFKQSKKKTV